MLLFAGLSRTLAGQWTSGMQKEGSRRKSSARSCSTNGTKLWSTVSTIRTMDTKIIQFLASYGMILMSVDWFWVPFAFIVKVFNPLQSRLLVQDITLQIKPERHWQFLTPPSNGCDMLFPKKNLTNQGQWTLTECYILYAFNSTQKLFARLKRKMGLKDVTKWADEDIPTMFISIVQGRKYI
jgi:hypothetical protein